MDLLIVSIISSSVCVGWGNFHSGRKRSLVQISSPRIYATAVVNPLSNLNLVPKTERVSQPNVAIEAFAVNPRMIALSL